MNSCGFVVVGFSLFFSLQAFSGTGQVGSVDAKKTTQRMDFSDCLKVINEKSYSLKGKIFPLSADGWGFAVKGNEEGSMTIYSEDGAKYEITKSNRVSSGSVPKYSKCENISDTSFAGASVVDQIYQRALKDTKTSLESRKEIVARCNAVAVGVPMPKPGMGMMMGIPEGTGSIMGVQPAGVN